MNFRKIFLTVLLFAPLFLFSQEELRSLSANGELFDKIEQQSLKSEVVYDTLKLPFFDDFSSKSVFPLPNHWMDNYAFVNNGFGILPPSIGVATMDAMDADGYVYENANPFGFSADTLTSRPIRLDSLFNDGERPMETSDSLYLSFYYQPQGYGNSPETADSLILEFLAVNENDTLYIEAIPEAVPPIEADTIILEGWRSIWSVEGMSYEDFYNEEGKHFRQALIPIVDSARYYNKHFKFRFRNIASIDGNNLDSWKTSVDQWNIDYIRLENNRTFNDTTNRDLTFVGKSPSFLKNYTAMPHWQYAASLIDETALSVDLKISNLSENNILGHYKYQIFNNNDQEIHTYSGGEATLSPFHIQNYSEHSAFANPPIADQAAEEPFIFPITGNETTYKIVHSLWGDGTIEQSSNDTLIYYQNMNNYYSYDDGIAESGYGFSSSFGKFACYYEVNALDTLRGAQIMFNHIVNEDQTSRAFRICVWSYSNAHPGELIYSQDFGSPETYDGNLFHIYKFDEYVTLSKSEKYYIGIEQLSDEFLNIGFDRNNDISDNTRVNSDGTWESSAYAGTPMIRPVMGSTISSGPFGEGEFDKNQIQIYPNPTNSNGFNVKLESSENYSDFQLEIYSTTGTLVKSMRLENRVSCNELVDGLYFVRITNINNNKTITKKLIVSK